MLSPLTSSSKSRNLKGKYMSSYQKSFRQVPLLTGGGGGGGVVIKPKFRHSSNIFLSIYLIFFYPRIKH